MKSTCWDTRATDSIINSGQKDTEASMPCFWPIFVDFRNEAAYLSVNDSINKDVK